MWPERQNFGLLNGSLVRLNRREQRQQSEYLC